MNVQFDKYLKENKVKYAGETFTINDQIEFYPKMIESLYKFLLNNPKYKTVEFGENVVFKGRMKDYGKCIEFAKQSDVLLIDAFWLTLIAENKKDLV